MCSNLLVRHYYLSCLCLYKLSLCKNKYVSWSTTPIYSVFEAISKRRFLHRKNLSTSYRRDHSQQQKEVSTLAKREILVSLLPCLYAYYPNSSAGVFRCLRKERFLHRKISYNTLHLCLHGNALPLSQKRDFHSVQFVAATGCIQKKLLKQRFFHGKKEVSTCLFWLIGL